MPLEVSTWVACQPALLQPAREGGRVGGEQADLLPFGGKPGSPPLPPPPCGSTQAVVEHLLARSGVFAHDLAEAQLENRVLRLAHRIAHLRSMRDVHAVKLTPADSVRTLLTAWTA